MNYEQSNVGMGMVPHRKNCRCLECDNERLRADNERLREDAERYRWLRTPGIEQVRIMADLDESIGWNDSLDAAIDAARKP